MFGSLHQVARQDVCHTPSLAFRHPSFLQPLPQLVTSLNWALDPKLPALVYDSLPPTTAIVDYAIGLEKLPANKQFFSDPQTAVSLYQTTQIILDVSFIN